MNVMLQKGESGPYPAPANHIQNDPTPRDQAVYIPSVTPGYAIAAYEKKWTRALPKGVGDADLNFLDPANSEFFHISHVMSSAGQALMQRKSCIVQARDRKATMLIADSGGYQIANGSLIISGDQDRLEILRWLERHADWAMTLDVPTGPLERPGYRFTSFRDCLKMTLGHLEFFQRHRTPDATKFLNVLQGNTTRQSDIWFDAVKGFDFQGWAFAGKLRHNFFNLCRRIIKMADQNLIQNRNWIHVLGVGDLETAVGLSALQRAINRNFNRNLRVSFDTSSPFRIARWGGIYRMPIFEHGGMSLPQTKPPNARKFVGSAIQFPWPSRLGDKMTLGDLNVRQGINLESYHDLQSGYYLSHHNLWMQCDAIGLANRVFDSESLNAENRVSEKMCDVVVAIDTVLNSGSLQTLERKRSVFNAVKRVERPEEYELDRDFLED